jgi:PERQ amino acid-rich with GYF domain-containing protein
MTAEEKELFATDVNSPLKIPQQNKDGNNQGAGGQNGRKASVSHSSTAGYGVSSPSTASRPGTRRRETTDTNPFPNSAIASPTASRFESSWFSRKNTETKEPVTYDEPEEDNAASRDQASKTQPFAALNRLNTTGSSGFGASASIWGNSTAAVTPALGGFGNFALPTPATAEKRFGSTRGESRLAHLIPKETGDTSTSKPGENANQDFARSWRARPRTDTDPFGGDDRTSGSAALGGSHDASPPSMSSQPQGASIFDTPVKGNAGDFGMSGLTLGGDGDANGPASPSETNPYRSPPADRGDSEHDNTGPDRSHVGHTHEPPSNFSTISRAFGTNNFEGSDRSQTSSVGAKGYPSLTNLTGWPAGPSAGTPDRERPAFTAAFGSSLFSPVGDMQSPGLGNLSGMFSGPATSNIGSTGSLRGSKLGSLFPPAMQAQMQNPEQDPLSDSIPDLRQSNPLGAIGRGPVGMQPREMESPLRSGRGVFEDLFPSVDSSRLPFTTGEQGLPGLTATTQGQSFTPTSIAPPFSTAQSSDPPAAQARTMVMPDRMRWVYLDPQGQTQGPFSGLEMNDWYKAQFFTPDLRVKKVEDPDFEPLGQLIRRIGNSREPFLVPQIGIPHGPPSQAGPFSPGDTRGVIPPLMGAFPSFGRTLTAEEQNNLERRKQEEQILMARQREFLAHQQAFTKVQMPGAPGTLQHHSSAHSLQSQPSFGSITSPLNMAAQAQPSVGAMGPNPNFFDPAGNLLQSTPSTGMGIDTNLLPQDLTPQERQMLASFQPPTGRGAGFAPQPIGAPPADSGLRSQLPGIDQLQHDSQGFSARLREFQDLRAQRDAEEMSKAGLPEVTEDNAQHERLANAAPTTTEQAIEVIKEVTRTQAQDRRAAVTQAQQQLSLTQLVQKTQAAAAAAAAAVASKQPSPDNAWAKPSTSGLPMPFPPPSSTPLPAPTAQRQKSTLPTQFTSPSPTGTPDTLAEAAAPPPLAPWAQAGVESHKGPSLKEIQEAEAKKAAKAEEAAAAARRALMEQETAALREREKASASVASGLPSTSRWGAGSPVNTPTASSPWAKPAAVKGAVAGLAPTVATVSANERKKTLAEIQREEEARKRKARELAMQQGVTTSLGLGKRYADLASKTSAPPGLVGQGPAGVAPSTGGAQVAPTGWATVGAGGKVKAPAGPPAQSRVASSSAVKPVASPAIKPASRPANPPAGSKDGGSDAMQEFHKWLHRELARGLSGITDSKPQAPHLLCLSESRTNPRN